jgi:Ca-activated chloride channel family protein
MTQWAVIFALALPAVARGQGLLVVVDPAQQVRLPRPIIIYPRPIYPRPIYPQPVPFPPQPAATYKVDELEVNARLVDQVAEVQVSQSFQNTGSMPLEVSFIFPLPYEGAVHQLTLLIDGKEYEARLLDAKEARRRYEEIVRKNRDPALLEWLGTGMFQTSVFPVPPGGKRTVTLRYSQLCRQQEGLTDFLFPLSTAKYTSHPVEKVSLRVSISSREAIKNVYSPSHAVEIQRPDDCHAVATYTCKNEVPSADFRLLYDVGRGKLSARVLSYRPEADQDGFFLLLASPEIKAPEHRQPKTVMFVIDRSGSMSGRKIEQVQAALKAVLNELREGDLFNIIAYDSEVESFRPELQRFDEQTRRAALGFVEGIYAGGSTNIQGALRTALGQLQDPQRPTYIVFLTDGIPTVGETNEQRIIAAAVKENKVHARIFVFGVGYDVNARFLDKLARECYGQSEYVRPNEDIEARVAALYKHIQSPVLTGLQLEFAFDEVRAEEGRPVNRVYPKDSFDLFAGEQLVVVGRYKKAGAAKVVVRGSVGGEQQKFDFPANFVEKTADDSNAFIEKLWAIRRVGEILDELDLRGRNDELVNELVELSKRHGILTPYTSFMADENTNLHDLAWQNAATRDRIGMMEQTSGEAGVAQRAFKGGMRAAKAPAFAFSNDKAAASAYAAPLDSTFGAGSGPGSGGGNGSGSFGFAGGGLAHGQLAREADDAEKKVRNVGNRTFYRRQGQWVDSRLSKDQQDHAKKLKQFSDEYFALAQRYGRTMSQYLVFDEPVLLNLDGQAYLIEP